MQALVSPATDHCFVLSDTQAHRPAGDGQSSVPGGQGAGPPGLQTHAPPMGPAQPGGQLARVGAYMVLTLGSMHTTSFSLLGVEDIKDIGAQEYLFAEGYDTSIREHCWELGRLGGWGGSLSRQQSAALRQHRDARDFKRMWPNSNIDKTPSKQHMLTVCSTWRSTEARRPPLPKSPCLCPSPCPCPAWRRQSACSPGVRGSQGHASSALREG
jgi:hypothetical protein